MHRCCWLHSDISINLAGNRLPSDLGSRRDPAFVRRGVAGAAERYGEMEMQMQMQRSAALMQCRSKRSYGTSNGCVG